MIKDFDHVYTGALKDFISWRCQYDNTGSSNTRYVLNKVGCIRINADVTNIVNSIEYLDGDDDDKVLHLLMIFTAAIIITITSSISILT